jgi:hypothetical protein
VLARRRLGGRGLKGRRRDTRAPDIRPIALRACSSLIPCFSLFSPFSPCSSAILAFDNPLKTVCFQMVGQKAPSRAEQDHNREIIRAYQGDCREITG